MSVTDQSTIRNQLLARLPAEDFARMAGELESLPVTRGEILARPNEPVDYVYFPEDGILSLVAVSGEGHRVEAGLLGREGFGPISGASNGGLAALEAMVQGEGTFIRFPAPLFQEMLDGGGPLARGVRAFLHVMAVQVSFTALSNAAHLVEERLARWLLMCHDRLDGDRIVLTHQFLAIMLAVRRPSVTTALHLLEGNGFIHSERGVITVRDRKAMEAFAADVYGSPEAEYRRLLGDFGRV
jgi:CRP-like cAMP-binding protein